MTDSAQNTDIPAQEGITNAQIAGEMLGDYIGFLEKKYGVKLHIQTKRVEIGFINAEDVIDEKESEPEETVVPEPVE